MQWRFGVALWVEWACPPGGCSPGVERSAPGSSSSLGMATGPQQPHLPCNDLDSQCWDEIAVNTIASSWFSSLFQPVSLSPAPSSLTTPVGSKPMQLDQSRPGRRGEGNLTPRLTYCTADSRAPSSPSVLRDQKNELQHHCTKLNFFLFIKNGVLVWIFAH